MISWANLSRKSKQKTVQPKFKNKKINRKSVQTQDKIAGVLQSKSPSKLNTKEKLLQSKKVYNSISPSLKFLAICRKKVFRSQIALRL